MQNRALKKTPRVTVGGNNCFSRAVVICTHFIGEGARLACLTVILLTQFCLQPSHAAEHHQGRRSGKGMSREEVKLNKLTVGQSVLHPRFGPGHVEKITHVEKKAAEVHVKFANEKMKLNSRIFVEGAMLNGLKAIAAGDVSRHVTKHAQKVGKLKSRFKAIGELLTMTEVRDLTTFISDIGQNVVPEPKHLRRFFGTYEKRGKERKEARGEHPTGLDQLNIWERFIVSQFNSSSSFALGYPAVPKHAFAEFVEKAFDPETGRIPSAKRDRIRHKWSAFLKERALSLFGDPLEPGAVEWAQSQTDAHLNTLETLAGQILDHVKPIPQAKLTVNELATKQAEADKNSKARQKPVAE